MSERDIIDELDTNVLFEREILQLLCLRHRRKSIHKLGRECLLGKMQDPGLKMLFGH